MNTPAKPDSAPAPSEPTEAPTRRDFLSTLAASGAATAALLAAETNAKPVLAAAKDDPASVAIVVNWEAFLHRHDMVWEAMPLRWEDGAFIGDGQQGAMLFNEASDRNTLRFEINRSDVTDRGKRLAVGQLHIPNHYPVKESDPFNLRVGLWNGELLGDNWRAYAHATDHVLVWEGVSGPVSWHPEPALDARKVYRKEPITEAEKHPDPTQTTEPDGTHVCVQPLTGGAAWAVAWREDAAEGGVNGANRRILLSVGYSAKSADEAKREAVGFVQKAAKRPAGPMLAEHQKWWNEFWPQSFFIHSRCPHGKFLLPANVQAGVGDGKGKTRP